MTPLSAHAKFKCDISLSVATRLTDGGQADTGGKMNNLWLLVNLRERGMDAHLKHKALLTAVGDGELDFAVQPPGPQQSRIQSVRSVGCHDNLRWGTAQCKARCACPAPKSQ